jgi:hypothetical protein
MNDLELSALDGANPLGFLGALGTLAVLSETDSSIKLAWKTRARWTPFLTSPLPLDRQKVLQHLAKQLRGKPVNAQKEVERQAAQKQFDMAKKALKNAKERLKKRGLRGEERDEAFRIKISPCEASLKVAEKQRQSALKEAVPSPELALGQRPDCTIEEFRDHARSFLAEAGIANRRAIDLLAAFGVEIADDDNDRIQPTPFCFITGSGHQWFLDTARQLMACVSEEKLREALFEPWAYRDEKLTMRWDPLDDRRYALMDRDPTAPDNKSATVWMANLLGYFSLAFFPCAPLGHSSAAACWSLDKGLSAFRWPLWQHPLTSNAIRSLLTHRAFAAPDFEGDRKALRAELRARGVTAVFSARRIQVGNPPLHKINFSPASAF